MDGASDCGKKDLFFIASSIERIGGDTEE